MAYIWVNDGLVRDDTPHVPVRDRGFLLGDGLFETLRVHDGVLRNSKAHLARLQEGATVLGLTVPEGLDEALNTVLDANSVTEGSLRLTLTRGSGGRGLDLPEHVAPLLVITAASHSAMLEPVRLQFVPQFRRDEVSPLSRVKALGYLPNTLARVEARRLNADDALMANTVGQLACGTVANVLVWSDSHWFTPPLKDGALPGTARKRLLEAGLIQERSFSMTALQHVQGMALVNALSLRAVSQYNGVSLPWPLETCDSLARIGEKLSLPVEV